MRVINETYLTKSGRDIRECKVQSTFKICISENNQAVANKRIKLAESENARVARNAIRYVAK